MNMELNLDESPMSTPGTCFIKASVTANSALWYLKIYDMFHGHPSFGLFLETVGITESQLNMWKDAESDNGYLSRVLDQHSEMVMRDINTLFLETKKNLHEFMRNEEDQEEFDEKLRFKEKQVGDAIEKFMTLE